MAINNTEISWLLFDIYMQLASTEVNPGANKLKVPTEFADAGSGRF